MELKEAKRLAQAAISDGQRLTAAFDGSAHWFFSVGDSVADVVPGCSPIAIDKVSGAASYPMPSIPSILTGQAPTAAEVEMEQAREVALA